MTAAEQELKYADRIKKLLAQAENPAATEEEASAFMQRAATLMAKYAIDEQMIATARGLNIDELVQDEFSYTGIYRTGHQRVGVQAAKHFGLKVVLGGDTGRNPIRMPLFLAGFRSDVERARMLDTSLQLQMVNAHNQWWSANKDAYYWMDKGLAFRTRRDFTFGFADGVATKLYRARKDATVEATAHEAERAGTTVEAATTSVELVLVGRQKRVDEFYDTVWGGRTRSVTHRYSHGAGGSRMAGYSAGRAANTNTGAGIAGGNRKALG